MTKEVALVFPHQLFKSHPAVAPGRTVVLVEESLFFTQYRFHSQKLMLHRASMKAYERLLRESGADTRYIESADPRNDARELLAHLSATGVDTVHTAATVDDWLSRRLHREAERRGILVVEHDSPMFLENMTSIDEWFEGRKRYFQTDFYVWQRRKRGLLINAEGKPEGGKWTYDTENRGRYPKGGRPPVVPLQAPDGFLLEAAEYVGTRFPDAYGDAHAPFDGGLPWAWTHAGAEALLDDFLENRLPAFGVYEDAMVAEEHFLHHSVLTPMLNIGLLEPGRVVEKTLKAAARGGIPLNSLEGFLRQVVGWREFIRAVYEREGRSQRTKNFWGFNRRIPASFWTGTTGIVPVDTVVRKTLRTGYAHHIERLMVVGNFLLLCEFDPDEVYRWFMEMFVDSYDWVMVPNVYGMSQFADGGTFTTKPYLSGSNYLLKMSDEPKGPWCAIWDGLFWSFIGDHESFFLKNPRLSMMAKSWQKQSPEKQAAHRKAAGDFLSSLS